MLGQEILLTISNCLFETTSTVKKSDTEKWIHSGYGITFNCAGLWNSDNDFA